MPTITAFQRSPDQGRGLGRDMPVRWALEEVGQPYDVRGLSFEALKQPAHRLLQPFGQIPTYEEGELVLFESGAIVLHVAQQAAASQGGSALLPADANARARAITWLFAALSTLEPPIVDYTMAQLFERDAPGFETRQRKQAARVHQRLAELADRLGTADWLEGDFSVGDLMVVAVLRRLQSTGLLSAHPTLLAYVARGQARPAFQRAFAAQLAAFQASSA